jgi:tetratricopeptide (TPR) repeat protein
VLTQSGKYEEAESLLLSVQERTAHALLDLGWLYERKNDLTAALKAYEQFLAVHPDHLFAAEQQLRIRARLAEPESLIEEVAALSELGEEVAFALFPEYVQRLFETGHTLKARDEIAAKMRVLDAKTGSRLAWVCYQAKAYDIACALFLAHLRANLSYPKYLNAMESAAAKCSHIPQVLEAYRAHASEFPGLYGRAKALVRRSSARGTEEAV